MTLDCSDHNVSTLAVRILFLIQSHQFSPFLRLNSHSRRLRPTELTFFFRSARKSRFSSPRLSPTAPRYVAYCSPAPADFRPFHIKYMVYVPVRSCDGPLLLFLRREDRTSMKCWTPNVLRVSKLNSTISPRPPRPLQFPTWRLFFPLIILHRRNTLEHS